MRRALALAFFLLLAQQVALVHAIGHLDATPPQGETRLCDLHSAMGSVLGGLHAAPPSACLEEAVFQAFAAPHEAQASLPAPSPASRGPPSVFLK